MRRHRLVVVALLAVVGTLTLLTLQPKAQASAGPERTVRLALLSDVHYVSPTEIPTSDAGRAAFNHAESAEVRLMSEIDPILVKALGQAVDSDPDALLVSGDLTSNGEYGNAEAFAARLQDARDRLPDDTGVYVVNGNHDMNMSYAADFTEEGVEDAERIQQDDWRAIFDGLGYGEEGFSYYADTNPDAAADGTVRNSGGLSYSTRIADGVTLIALDTARYGNNAEERFNAAQETPGSVSAGLLAWAKEQAAAAKAKGDLVLVMAHHAMIPHTTVQNSTIDSFMKQVVVTNWQEVADTLADAGVTAYLTGHSHSNDIAKYVTPSGRTIYDINTAGLCAYPCAWRTLDIGIHGEGADATYDFSIDTNFIGSIEGISDLQSHAYEKTGFVAKNIEPVVDYMARLTIDDIANFDEDPYGSGLTGYLNKALDLDYETQGTVGNHVTDKLAEAIRKLDTTQDFKFGGSSYKLGLKFKDEDETQDIYRVDVSLDKGGSVEQGVLSIDLTGLPDAVDNLIVRINNEMAPETWPSNYYVPPLQKDLNMFAAQVLVGTDAQPGAAVTRLDPSDPNSSVLGIVNEAYQAYTRGDEHTFVWRGLGINSPQELANKREHWNELLRSETLADNLRNALYKEFKKSNSPEYPTLAQILKDTKLKDDGDEKVFGYTGQSTQLFSLLNIVAGQMENVKTASDLVTLFNLAPANPISSDMMRDKVAAPVANMQEAFTHDSNIPSDATWRFHSVLFDACGGVVSPSSDLTVESGRLGRSTVEGLGLPTPTRDGYVFDGWFTAPQGGSPIDVSADFTNVSRIYAHWTQRATMHRLYNPNSGEHFYTSNAGERDAVVAAGWTYEGVGWIAPAASDTPVYRLYNPNAGDHHYTTDAGERDVLVGFGWIDEGIGWYSASKDGVAVWRQYNPNAVTGTHNFTTDRNEHLTLVRLGWRAEGIAWYALP